MTQDFDFNKKDLDSNKKSNFFQNLIMELLVAIVSGSGGLTIHYIEVNNPLYNTYLFVASLTLIASILILFFYSSGKTKTNKIFVISFFIFIAIVIFCIAPRLFPPFEITEPEKGDSVGVNYTIHGHGAIPGSSVKVYVEDDIGNKWPQNTVRTTRSGDWECERAIFGKERSDDIGKNFIIYATTLNKNNEIYETPHITVTRS